MRCNNKEKLGSFFFPLFSISQCSAGAAAAAAAACLAKSFVWWMHGSDIARRRDLRQLEFPSSADLLMQGNWPICQNHEETELPSRRCIKNGSTGPENGGWGANREEEKKDRVNKVEEEDEGTGSCWPENHPRS